MGIEEKTYLLLIWNGFKNDWDVLEDGSYLECKSNYDRHLLYYRTGVRLKVLERCDVTAEF